MEVLTALTAITVALITAVFGPISIKWVQEHFNRKKQKHPNNDDIEINIRINDILDEIIKITKGDRIWVAKFHNGGHFYPTGKAIEKFSVFYEKITPNAIPIQTVFQNVPLSLFPKILSKIYREKELFICCSKDQDEYDIQSIMGVYQSKSLYMLGLRDPHDRLIGGICLSFLTPVRLSQEKINAYKEKVNQIENLLWNLISK
jgi:hypothetical protein